MYVHIVKKGENLLQIGRSVGVEGEEIARLNGLSDEQLVPGLAVLVPTKVATKLMTYQVQAGDTLRKVANRFHMPERILLGANPGLNPEALPVGRFLTLPLPMEKRRPLEVNMRLEVQGDYEEGETVREARDCLTNVSFSAAYVEQDGTLILPPFEEAEHSCREEGLKRLLLLVPVDGEAAARVIGHGPSRRAFFSELRALVAQDGFRGVHLEFTALPRRLRAPFNAFVRELAARMRQMRGELYIAVPPVREHDVEHPRWGAYDIEWLGRHADRLVWNADEGYGRWDSPPTALAPLHLIEKSLRFAVASVPAKKILLGLPFYGYDWVMPYESDQPPAVVLQVPPGESERTEGPKQIHWDDRAMCPMFTYRDETGRMREVWYEDVRSIAAKLQLVQELGIAGISCRVQGVAAVGLWHLLAEVLDVHTDVS